MTFPVHHNVHKRLPLVPNFSQKSPVHTLQTYLRCILILCAHLCFILPSSLLPTRILDIHLFIFTVVVAVIFIVIIIMLLLLLLIIIIIVSTNIFIYLSLSFSSSTYPSLDISSTAGLYSTYIGAEGGTVPVPILRTSDLVTQLTTSIADISLSPH